MANEELYNFLDVSVIKNTNGPGDFGFGLSMNSDNIITFINKEGTVWRACEAVDQSTSLLVGMQITMVNDIYVNNIRNVTFTINNYFKDTNRITLKINKKVHPIYENYYNLLTWLF